MSLSEAFNLYGPDTIAISEALGIPEHEAERLINDRMDERHARRVKNSRLRDELREIRRRCAV